jgi:DNA-binding LacI/PurR family transcriptional regulator
MNPIERSSLVDRTAAALLASLRAGQWTGLLPGVRVLCAALKVSPPTLQAATARLVDQGVLISRGSRRKLEIAAGPAARKPPAGTGPRSQAHKRVLCLTDDTLEQMGHLRLEILTQLRVRHRHWDLRHRVFNYGSARVPHRHWDEVLRTEHPDHLIVFGGNPVVAQWAKSRGVPVVFIGGDALPEKIPTVGFTPMTMVPEAVKELLRLGHRDICLPMFGLFPRLEEAQRAAFRTLLEAAGITFDPAWHTPSSPHNSADIVTNAMIAVAARAMPTAIIAMTWNEFVSIHCFLSRCRLRIPEDVSVIVLRGSASMEWFRPSLTRFAMSAASACRIVQRWIDDAPPADPQVIGVSGKLIHGESTAPPRRTK